jgi:iron complex outermembrane receptor protein
MLKKLFCVFILCSAVCLAEEAEVIEGGKVIVEADKPARNLLKTPAAESAALEIATSTVDSRDITLQNAATLTDAMNFAPGILTETRGRKYKSFTSFRGQIYPYPTYALNGIWQREFQELVYMLPASQIEQIEMIRSSGTLLLGLGDITGVINIIPKRYEKPTTVIEGDAGTFNTWRAGIAHGSTVSNGWYTVGATAFATDGPSGRNAAERAESIYGYGGLQARDRLYFEGQFFAIEGSRELMRPDPDGPAQNTLKNRTEEYDPFNAYHLGGKILFEQSPNAALELIGGYTERSYHYNRIDNPAQNALERDYEYNVQLMQALELSDANTLRFGGVYNHWVAPDGKRSYTGTRQDVETIAGVITDEHQFEKLTLDAGLRVVGDYYNEYSGSSFNINGQNRDFDTVKDEWGDPLVTATLGAKYQATDALAFYAHLAGGQRNAEPGALKADGSDLENESRVMIDAGVKLENPEKGMAKFGGFCVLRKDAITKVNVVGTNTVTGDTFYFSDNQDIVQYGLELETRTAPLAGIATLFFNTTLMDSRFKAPGTSGYSDYVEIPDWIISGGLYSEAGRTDFTLVGKYVSGYSNFRFAQDGNYHPLGDYTELNAAIGYTLGKKRNTRLYASASNLLDDGYSTVVGWSDPGLEFRFGARHEF